MTLLLLAVATAGLAALKILADRPRLVINPRYRAALQASGLMHVEDFLALRAVVVAGHADRNAGRIVLGKGASAVACYLKREHRVPWSDRLANARAGFGWVSKSLREAAVLGRLAHAGPGAPEVLAAGQRGRRAFLLVREVAAATELRSWLRDHPDNAAGRRLARALGRALADVHAAGLVHGDLYSKHVLVGPGEALRFLDWQRGRRRRRLGVRERARDLAALDATVAAGRASRRERLACFAAYVRAWRTADRARKAALWRRTCWESSRLGRRRRIRDLRRDPVPAADQSVLWLDGEAFCATPDFAAALGGHVPRTWDASSAPPTAGTVVAHQTEIRGRTITVAGRRAVLARRREFRPARALWFALGGRRWTSPEIDRAGVLFRLGRYGVAAPRPLAFGQRCGRLGTVESFLLTEEAPEAPGLVDWLAARPAAERRSILPPLARFLGRLHEAGCTLGRVSSGPEGAGPWPPLEVAPGGAEGWRIVLADPHAVRTRRRTDRGWAARDLAALWEALRHHLPSPADHVALVVGYLNAREAA